VQPGALTSLVDVDVPTAVTHTIGISVTPGLTWTAVLDPSGTLPASLSQTSGSASTDLELTFSSNGLSSGTYATTVTVEVTPAVPGSPFTVPVELLVVPDLHKTFLPAVLRP
jgi:hypothetical protein